MIGAAYKDEKKGMGKMREPPNRNLAGNPRSSNPSRISELAESIK